MCLIKLHIDSPIWLQHITLVILSIFSMAGLVCLYKEDISINVEFYEYYQKNLRGYLFSGFISVGSFLLSLHTFVIVNLKEKLFGTEDYKKTYAEALSIEQDEIDESKLYKPLDNLSCFINLSIWLSIATAISQFTIGIANNTISSLVCIWLAIATILFMLNSLIIIRENIKIFLKQKNYS